MVNILIKIYQKMRRWKWRNQCLFGKSVVIDKNTFFEGVNRIHRKTTILNNASGYAMHHM